jgi:amidase
MATFITRLDKGASGLRLAVKDLIDVQGVPTTAGSRAVAARARPAADDAPCLAGARAAGAVIVGKVNLHELAYGASGINDWFGTPVNPLDPRLVPGGSSSGSAVAVGEGSADVAYGSDTGGSIRIPAACCGITGLKTTHGRVPLTGVWPLAPSLDTVGPMAVGVAGVAAGMALLEPGFLAAGGPAVRVGRLRLADADVDPKVEDAVDAALRRSELELAEVTLDGWRDARWAASTIIDVEAAEADRDLMADPAARALLGESVRTALADGAYVPAGELARARAYAVRWRAEVDALFRDVELLALPTMVSFPPALEQASGFPFLRLTMPVNLAGLPALALPVPAGQGLPASLQLIGPAYGEQLLLATGALIEAAAGYRRPG